MTKCYTAAGKCILVGKCTDTSGGCRFHPDRLDREEEERCEKYIPKPSPPSKEFLDGIRYAIAIAKGLADDYDRDSEAFYVAGEANDEWHARIHASTVAREVQNMLERRVQVAEVEGWLPLTKKP